MECQAHLLRPHCTGGNPGLRRVNPELNTAAGLGFVGDGDIELQYGLLDEKRRFFPGAAFVRLAQLLAHLSDQLGQGDCFYRDPSRCLPVSRIG
jgi:hypothetical protein